MKRGDTGGRFKGMTKKKSNKEEGYKNYKNYKLWYNIKMKTDVLLINPSMDFSKFGSFARLLEPMPCIGLAYLAGVLEKEGYKVEVIDDFVIRKGKDFIINLIGEKKPKIVGISCLTPSAPTSFEVSKAIKEKFKDVKIVMGNIHAGIFAKEILKAGYADVIVHGEGEEVIKKIVPILIDGKNPDGIKGVSFIKDGEISESKDVLIVENLDSLPFPAWHLFPYTKYGLLPFADIKKPILTVLGSRGCPYKCAFCSLKYFGRRYRKRSVKNVVDEIEYLIDRFKIKQFGFVDPIFPLDREHAIEFSKEMIKRGVNKKVVWTTETRPDMMDFELARIMKEAGLRRIIFGLESGVEELLRNIKKEYNLERVREAVNACKKAGLETIGLFMIGLPGETPELTLKTLKFAIELDLDFAKFAITVPFPGSELYEKLTKEGKLNRRDWENFTTFNPVPDKIVYVPDGMTPQQLIKLQRYVSRKFYLRPRMILKQILKIRTISPYFIWQGILSFLGIREKN